MKKNENKENSAISAAISVCFKIIGFITMTVAAFMIMPRVIDKFAGFLYNSSTPDDILLHDDNDTEDILKKKD